MAHLQRTVLWTAAACVLGYGAIRALVVGAPAMTLAQSPEADRRPAPPPSPAKVIEPAVDGATVTYPFDTLDVEGDARRLQKQYAGRANIGLENRSKDFGVPYLLVRAPADVQAEIRAVVSFLTKQRPEPVDLGGSGKGGQSVPARGGDRAGDRTVMSMPTPQATLHGYLGLAQRQQEVAQERIRIAQQTLTSATTNEEKAAARTQLRKLLADVFDQDMKMREEQATEIESRLTKLRRQYQDREKVKNEIIDLQFKVIEQHAAGLGFPGGPSFRATPPFPSGNRSNLPTSATPGDPHDPLIRSGLPSPNVPARRADKYDPIPQERTLEESRKTRPAEIAELKKRNHFIESTDGKIYAYANTNQPSGPSHIRVVDSATGKLIAAADVNSVVGPLEFTDQGVASREADGVLQLRVPLKRRTGPEGAVFEVPSSTAQAPFDPKQAGLEPEFLKKYSTEPQTRVGELSARGHFVGSQDGKLYAYIETSSEGIPEGTAEIRVCDARTGQRLAAAKIKAPVGRLKFFNEGVATEDADGTLRLRLSFSADYDTQDVLETTPVDEANPGTSQRVPTATAGSHAGLASEYSELRNQYRKDQTSFNASVPPGLPMPELARLAGVSVREMLAFKPEGAAIDYDQPSDAEIATCRVVLEPGDAWTLLDRDLVLLRRFVDTNHDGVVDLWAYYKSGKEVWRDVDTDFDGKADHHNGVDCAR